MTKRFWTVSAHKDQDHVELYELTLKARFKMAVERAVDEFDYHVTRHWLCGSGMPKWFWEHSLGKPQWDREYDLLDNSIAMHLHNMYDRLVRWSWDEQTKCKVMSVPITRAQLKELWPDCDFLADDNEEEDKHGR